MFLAPAVRFILVYNMPSLVLPLFESMGHVLRDKCVWFWALLWLKWGSEDLEKGQNSPSGKEITEENMTEDCKILSETGKLDREGPCIFSSGM